MVVVSLAVWLLILIVKGLIGGVFQECLCRRVLGQFAGLLVLILTVAMFFVFVVDIVVVVIELVAFVEALFRLTIIAVVINVFLVI